MQSFEYESTISEMVRSDAYDLLKSICLEKDWCIIEQNYSWNLAETAAVGIPMEMFFYSWVRLHICKTLKNGTAVKVLEALCTYSRKRANTNHKEVIVRAISQMGEDGPEAVCRIGDAEQQLLRMTFLYMRVILLVLWKQPAESGTCRRCHACV